MNGPTQRIAVCLWAALVGAGWAAKPTIRLEHLSSAAEAARFIVEGFSQEVAAKLANNHQGPALAEEVFRVYSVSSGQRSPSAMLGEYELTKGTLVFRPRFPLAAGVTYRAVWCAPSVGEPATAVAVEQDFPIPKPPAGNRARLVAIYPSGNVLPENLLRFYLHFSAPMSRGEAYQQIRLVADDGKVVEYPFLELSEELWSPDGKRFTLYFDPGRIKRGLKPRELFGPALEEGRSYTLVVDGSWSDANGEPLEETVRKQFRVAAPDDVQPNPERWQVTPPPRAGTRQVVVVDFEEPLDEAMLHRVIGIRDGAGNTVRGRPAIDPRQQRWAFEPAEPWLAGDYQLVVSTALEDLAGNSIAKPFEVDIIRPASTITEAATVAIPFRIVE